MRTPVILTSRLPTIEEIAKLSNMSPSRVAELVQFADKLIAEREKGRGRRVATKRAAKTGTATKKKRVAKANRLKKK
jgi:hypothetical protein